MIKRNPAASIVGLVFSILGTVFTAVGVVFLLNRGSFRGMPLFFPLIFAGLGTAFLLTALILLLWALSKEKRRKAVRDRGTVVTATVTDVRRNTSIMVNGRSPYVVECRYEANGQTYLLSSECIWTGKPEVEPGAKVPVYWDDYDPKSYTVDLSGLTVGQVTDLR